MENCLGGGHLSGLALNEDHDVFLEGGTLSVATGADFVVQKIRTLLLAYRGEWYLNTDSGVPWFQTILTNPTDVEENESILKRVILTPRGVTSITEFTATFDEQERDMTVVFRVDTIYGPSGIEEVTI